MTARKMLAVFAHPDDETFICGGTLAHYAKKGVEITLVSATRGEMGRRMGNPPYVTRETMPTVREQELKKACEALGVRQLLFLDIIDKTIEFENHEALTNRIAGLIREYQPDLVLTFHEVYGGHPDHCAIGKTATRAFFQVSQTASKGEYAPQHLYFISFGNSMQHPENYGLKREQITSIDISDSLKEKLEAFRCHRCQTQMDRWVWQPNALQHFGRTEYFIHGDNKKRSKNNDLFA